MKITVERELDVEELFEDMIEDFADYESCEDANLSADDITPELLADIFSELAKVASQRAR